VHQYAAHRAFIANRKRPAATPAFRVRQIAEIRPVAFAGMNDEEASRTGRRKQAARGLCDITELRDIVAERRAKSVWFEKVALHVDDDERSAFKRERKRIRFGDNLDHGANSRLEAQAQADRKDAIIVAGFTG
jgi:hypothetical protein